MAPLRLLLASIAVSSSHGSSNTVAITHRSTLASQAHAYAQQGLSVNIVKEKPLRDEEEYVTDFYSRVRDRRKAMFGRQLREQDVIERREAEDHSLDHYFDHRLPSHHSHHHPTKSEGKPAVDHEEVVAKGSSSCAARSVRGGGLTRPLRRQHDHDLPSATATGHQHHHEDHAHHGEEYCDTASARLDNASSAGHRRHGRRGGHHGHPRRGGDRHHHSSHHGHHSRSHQIRDQARSHGLLDDDLDDGYDGYDALDYDVPHDEYGLEEEGHGGDDYPEHHLGLLRVPCSIAINAGEGGFGHHHQHASSHHHHHHQGGSPAKTEVAAYVDTGAQVTVISAAAAKRAGIYHLMDRRYAGRATGVGHCRVLGRIPARHVYFMLGEGCDEEDEEGGYDDDVYRDGRDVSRGGGSEHGPQGANAARMDGPALTVLEGTVTRGVDILLGLDVLRDWEAEIRMGARQSLTVRKRRNRHGGGGSVVIPFASPAGRQAEAQGTASRPSRRVGRRDPHGHRPHHPRASTTTTTPAHRRHKPASHDILREEEEDDYSPTASDIESDLDLLDQSGHEFPEESYVDSKSIREMEDELLGIDSDDMDEDERDDDEDDEDLDLEEEDEEGDFDMAGL